MSQTEPTPEAVTQLKTYTNPVYPGYFADPFVWQYQGVYYAIGTGAAEAGQDEDEVTGVVGAMRQYEPFRSPQVCDTIGIMRRLLLGMY